MFAALTLLALLALHVLSPEFDPSWRMVSEYARGRYNWVLSAMFISWAASTWLLGVAALPLMNTKRGKTGLALLMLSGLGEAMASVFNIDHPLHDVAGVFGVLCLPVAAILISGNLGNQQTQIIGRKLMIRAGNLPWLSLVLFIASMILMYIQFTKAGGQVSAQLTALPKGVTGLNGWANRLLVITYCVWAAISGWFILRLNLKELHHRPGAADRKKQTAAITD